MERKCLQSVRLITVTTINQVASHCATLATTLRNILSPTFFLCLVRVALEKMGKAVFSLYVISPFTLLMSDGIPEYAIQLSCIDRSIGSLF